MKWPLKTRPVPRAESPFFNLLYLSARGQGGPDPTIVWTSEIQWEPLQALIERLNGERATMIGSTHFLVKAVGQGLETHPELNRRVIRRRIFDFARFNVCLATRTPANNEVNLVQVPDVDQKSPEQIAKHVWRAQLKLYRNDSPALRDRERSRLLPGWLFGFLYRVSQWLDRSFSLPVLGRLDRLRESPVLVNDFSHPRFPVMRGYKPSRQPDESKPLSVTLGRPEERVVWIDGQAVPRRFAPVCIRADHRICDSFQLSQFTSTVVRLLNNPGLLLPTINLTETVEPQSDMVPNELKQVA